MILLDTHVWIWLVGDQDRLSRQAREVADAAINEQRLLHISSISAWEIALLSARGRLALTMDAGDWIARCEALPFLEFVPVDNAIAVRSVRLPGPFHADPADRIIVATALAEGATLITSDRKILEYPVVKTLW